MKNTPHIYGCLLVAVMATGILASTTNEFVIPRGAKAGKSIRLVEAREVMSASQPGVTNMQSTTTVPIFGSATNATLTISVAHYNAEWLEGERVWRFKFCNIQISGATNSAFNWNSWEMDMDEPQGLRIFSTAKGSNYLCYPTANGIRVFRLKDNRVAQSMLEGFLASEAHPDALPKLPMSLLIKSDSLTNYYGQHFGSPPTVHVEEIQEEPEGMRLALRGLAPDSRCWFHLQGGAWVFLKKEPVNHRPFGTRRHLRRRQSQEGEK